MEKRYKSLSLIEFQEKFPDEDSCLAFLSQIKWSQGYTCRKRGHTHYCKGNGEYDRQCTVCRYIESPTAGTLFHRQKFSILMAFYIVFDVSTNKNGISSTELSRKLALRQKTCWLFKYKVMKAMESSKNFPMTGKVKVDETYVGEQDDQAIGRNEGRKKIVVVAIEKQGKGISRIYGKVIDTASRENLKGFMCGHIHPEATIKTDKWAGYKGLEKKFLHLVQENSEKKGKNFPQLHHSIMMFKAWLRGVHHSVLHLQAYINEYTYRFNRHAMKERIFENLIRRMVRNDPYMYQIIIS